MGRRRWPTRSQPAARMLTTWSRLGRRERIWRTAPRTFTSTAALAQDDLLAQGRRQPHITTPSEVKIPGLGPIHLPHIDTRIPGVPAYIDPEAERPREVERD